MPELTMKLEQQLSDLRSDQIAYKLTVENQGDVPIRLISIEPRLPPSVELLKISNSSLAEANARKAALLEELNNLLGAHLWSSSSDYRALWAEKQKEAFKQVFSVTGFFRFYFHLLVDTSKAPLAQLRREREAFAFKMTSLADAQMAKDRWVQKMADDSHVRILFEAKIDQLTGIDANMAEEDRHGLTAVEKNSQFTATYVLKFKRRLFEPAKYHLAFDVSYSTGEQSMLGMSIAENTQVSPYPLSLSMIAIAASLLGVLLKIALEGASNVGPVLVGMFWSLKLFVAPIVALIFFNVYEHTSIGKDLTMPVSWRSALLIGAICGLAQDRILAALKALIGL